MQLVAKTHARTTDQLGFHSLLGSGLASFLVFLKGLKLAGGLALGTSEGREGSLLGSEAPGRESQHGLALVCETCCWRLACRRWLLTNRSWDTFVLCIHVW